MGKEALPRVESQLSEMTVWQTTDGKMFEDHDAAWDHQSVINFTKWCYENICRGGEWSADMVAVAILEVWEVQPKSTERKQS